MEIIKSVNLAVRFLLELGALVAMSYWGFQTGSGLPAKKGISSPAHYALVCQGERSHVY